MIQLSLQFFYPLTEQIPLDLNYTDCEKPKLSTPNSINSGYVFASTGTTSTFITASSLTLDVDTTVVKLKEKPGICRKTLLKCIGIKWEVK